MRTPKIAASALVAILAAGTVIGTPAEAVTASTLPSTSSVSAADVAPLAGSTPGSSTAATGARTLLAGLAAATLTPAQAVAKARSEAASNGITNYISVTNVASGAVVAQTANSGTQVASESIVKLMIAAYYMVIAGGYQNQSATVRDQLSYMIRYSDDATASAYFTSAAVPTIAARYGMSSTINATDRVGHWGAARITAHDMTTFLYRAAHDPQVGPWLMPVMAQVAPNGSDGFNQHFGMNALTGTHGSKQGWGQDQFWTSASSVINSVGYTDRYYVAILQLSNSYPDPARATSTYAASTIAASRVAAAAPPPPAPLRDGDFVVPPGSQTVYRIAGGAPLAVSAWSAVGGGRAVRRLTAAQWAALRSVPADGTFISAYKGGQVYRIAGGAPIYVSSWGHLGGAKPTVAVDAAAIAHAGQAGAWAHLRAVPADGTFIVGSGDGAVYRVVAGTPTYVTSWSNFPGRQTYTVVDAAAVSRAGQTGIYSHLRKYLPEGSFIQATGSGAVYRIVGSAPVYVSSWSPFGGAHPAPAVDSLTIARAGLSSRYANLTAVPRDGTFVLDPRAGAVYRIAGGAPLYVANWNLIGGARPTVAVDPAAIAHGGQGGYWAHLKFYPADGSFIEGAPGGKIYRVVGGKASYVSSWAAYGGPHPSVLITQVTIDRAGTGGYYAHLR